MAGAVPEGQDRCSAKSLSEEEFREYERKLYDRLLAEGGIHTIYMRDVLGLDPKMVQYFFNTGPVWSEKKRMYVERILKGVKDLYPHFYELIEELEEYLCILKEFAASKRS